MGSSASTNTRRSTTAQSTVVTSLSVVTTPLSPVRPKPCRYHPTPTLWAVRKTPWDTSNALCPRDLRSTSSKRSITTRRSSDSPQGSTPACPRTRPPFHHLLLLERRHDLHLRTPPEELWNCPRKVP